MPPFSVFDPVSFVNLRCKGDSWCTLSVGRRHTGQAQCRRVRLAALGSAFNLKLIKESERMGDDQKDYTRTVLLLLKVESLDDLVLH